ncbi:hypothetical protein BU24DRAFT_406402 [Aaosphaeria arxii CBS 175.79]|uniref:Uncharacterized protein n=1 Tax=Aaosphaeria arxii CBS 175.79 TaxID=1450172 RepID=A0A6A5Y4R0_9PLEO|nr:uncharacterized protein BU24DRAFT_406402 [Aaosphaeria arxii CBS 175.79]KAF2019780.1 hypothetical protein BU24DRAFT_406402 [Aaosphaeria arxii CBS 175.79]
MCKFILVIHLCGHRSLLTTAKFTKLCDTALNIRLIQGLDGPPASCYPLPEDCYSNDMVAHANVDLGPCDACEDDAHWERDCRTIAELDAKVRSLLVCIADVQGPLQRAFTNPESKIFARIPSKTLRRYLESASIEFTFGDMFDDSLQQVWDSLNQLQGILQQDYPREVVSHLVSHIHRMIADMEIRLAFLHEIMKELDKDDLYEMNTRRRLTHLCHELCKSIGLDDSIEFPIINRIEQERPHDCLNTVDRYTEYDFLQGRRRHQRANAEKNRVRRADRKSWYETPST